MMSRADDADPDDDALAVSGIVDDRLQLIFTCCHPALGFEAQIALTLRTVAGLTTAEIGMAHGPATGLALLDTLDESGPLADYHLLPATRADLLRRLNRTGEAAAAYRDALAMAPTDAERRYVTRRLAEIEPTQPTAKT